MKGTVHGKKPSRLPSAPEIADFLRYGGTTQELAAAYQCSESVINHRLHLHGFSTNGEPMEYRRKSRGRTDLHKSAGGNTGVGYIYNEPTSTVPTEPSRYRGSPKPEGLDWDRIRADYLAAGGNPGMNGKWAKNVELSVDRQGTFRTYSNEEP